MLEKGEIRKIIPDTAHLVFTQVLLPDDLLAQRSFVSDALINIMDAQVPGPEVNRLRIAAGDNGDLDTFCHEHPEAVAVFCVEALEFLTLLGEDDLPVRQHAIHIQDEKFDGLSFISWDHCSSHIRRDLVVAVNQSVDVHEKGQKGPHLLQR